MTGAGSGIGAQICHDLCFHNITVYGLDFNHASLLRISTEIAANNPDARFHTIQCDLMKEEEIVAAFERIKEENSGVDILINCAGVLGTQPILEESASMESFQKVIQTNLVAVISCTRKAFKSMADRNVQGYIVNLCSIAGHSAQQPAGIKPITSCYFISKHAVKALNQMLNQELIYYGKSNIRVSNISPGIVGETNIGKGTEFDEILQIKGTLKPKDVSDTLMFILSTPSYVQVRDILLETVGFAFY